MVLAKGKRKYGGGTWGHGKHIKLQWGHSWPRGIWIRLGTWRRAKAGTLCFHGAMAGWGNRTQGGRHHDSCCKSEEPKWLKLETIWHRFRFAFLPGIQTTCTDWLRMSRQVSMDPTVFEIMLWLDLFSFYWGIIPCGWLLILSTQLASHWRFSSSVIPGDSALTFARDAYPGVS